MTAAQGRGAARIGVGTAALNSAMLVAILWMALGRGALAAEPKSVLVLYSNNRLVPGNIAVDRGLRAAMPSSRATARCNSSRSSSTSRTSAARPTSARSSRYLREKYADAASGRHRGRERQCARLPAAQSLAPVLRHSPVVHTASRARTLQAIPALPADVVGVPIEYDYRRHQSSRRCAGIRGTQRLVVVTGRV